MQIRQEENTPIGDYFHDCGLHKVFGSIEDMVDEFDVDTDRLNAYIDACIDKMKLLKGQVKKVEAEWVKKLHSREIHDSIDVGAD